MMENLPRIILERAGVRLVRWLSECMLDHHLHDDQSPASECERCFAVEVEGGMDAMDQPIWRHAADDDGYQLTCFLKEIAPAIEKLEG